MALPTYDRFIEPLLRYLAEHPDGVPTRDAHEAAAQALGLTDEDRQQLLPSGQPVFKNRAGWAHDRLKRAGLSQSPRRGIWQLTDSGFAFVRSHPAPLSNDDIGRLAVGFLGVKLRQSPEGTASLAVDAVHDLQPAPLAAASPDDRLAEAVDELMQSVAAELLEALADVSPSFFETIVLDLLHRMGYGTSRQDLQRVGGAGDGGIDGVISLDKLGLEKVYVQAKRWQQTIGRPEVQAFFGALAGQRARKGVFITTSSYSTQAIEYARSVENLVLVDGQRLARLMIEHEVGVSLRTVRIPRIDRDYFDEESS